MIKVWKNGLLFTSMYTSINVLLIYSLCTEHGAFGIAVNKWISTKNRSAKFDEFIKLYIKVFYDTPSTFLHITSLT